MTGGMSSYVRRGIWTVPAYLNLNAGMSTVKLDFQQAICPHEVVDISVSAGVGAVVLVVPEGWGQHRPDRQGHRLGVEQGRHHPASRQAAAHPPRQLGGRCGEGRYPSRHDRYMMRRNLKRGGADRPGGRSDATPGMRTVPGIRRPRPGRPPQDEANHRF